MRVYTTGRAAPSDLLDLQGVAGALVGLAASVGAKAVGVPAATWKGQVPRSVMGARVEAEVARRGWQDRVDLPRRATHRNDVFHAIGIGLYAIKAGISTA